VTDPAAPIVAGVRPTPDDDEMAAIAAAIQMVWPKPTAPTAADEATRWRFSGRWWSRPVPVRRDRP
jgi:hypothetical protein